MNVTSLATKVNRVPLHLQQQRNKELPLSPQEIVTTAFEELYTALEE